MTDAVSLDIPAADERRSTARRIFRGALAFNAVLTVFWLASLTLGESTPYSQGYQIDRAAIGRVFSGIVFFYVVWGAVWWVIKGVLLRRFVGFTREEVRASFTSRLRRPFDVADLTARYSERRIRIVDMIGRRGRFITLAAAAFYYLYLQISADHNPNFAMGFIEDNLFDAVVTSWVYLGFFHADNWLGALFYGPQSRVMDGVLARANCLLITTLWTVFKFVMVPIGAALAGLFQPAEFAAVFVMIWGAYIAADASAEVVGSLIGRQRIRVWGVGDVNRKSIAGTVGGFTAALLLCGGVVLSQGLGGAWLGLAVVIALSTTLLELYSPRGTDDFTMATTNALICLAFGLWIR